MTGGAPEVGERLSGVYHRDMKSFLLERRTVADHHVCRFTVRDGYGVGQDLGSSNDALIQVGELGGGDAGEYLGRRGRARCHSDRNDQ